MSNRAQRRAQKKAKPSYQRLTPQQQAARMMKQGISPKDLDKAFDDGFEQGRKVGLEGTYKICFAAVCLALNDAHKFGAGRCLRVLRKMQEYIIDTLTSAEAVHAVYKRMGLTIDFGDPVAWVDMED